MYQEKIKEKKKTTTTTQQAPLQILNKHEV